MTGTEFTLKVGDKAIAKIKPLNFSFDKQEVMPKLGDINFSAEGFLTEQIRICPVEIYPTATLSVPGEEDMLVAIRRFNHNALNYHPTRLTSESYTRLIDILFY